MIGSVLERTTSIEKYVLLSLIPLYRIDANPVPIYSDREWDDLGDVSCLIPPLVSIFIRHHSMVDFSRVCDRPLRNKRSICTTFLL